ncbi:hypothetical protein AUP40_04320 [Thalassospira xiamenensis]|uniref:Tail assembly chaperone n=2 Tax=Thalassospiraceae TaxID=2844866 RepID=A0ABR5XXT7_9PROT|nr:hypothetical protein AUP40_04320 [Thalassospira xiamenensis]PXX36281.1 hypothetical protein C7967_101674 [Thalassospira sp. 11-3]
MTGVRARHLFPRSPKGIQMTKTKQAVATAPELTVTVAGTVHYLAPKLSAVRMINSFAGGLNPAYRKVRDLDFDAMAQIIVAGAGLKLKPSEYDDLVTTIWQEPDKAKLGADLINYITVLLNGGRPIIDGNDVADDAGDADEAPGKP